MTTYGLLNDGRDKNPAKSTEPLDERAVARLHEHVGDEDAVVFGVEVNEGDDNNELAVWRREFAGWHMCAGPPGRRVREPIFVSPDLPAPEVHIDWVLHSAVEHWSPQRSVMRVRLADRPETLIAAHYAAGPHTVGDRPDWARGPLNHSWDLTHAAHLAAKREEHKAGRDVTECFDANHYHLPGMPGEVTVFHERTDYGRALAAAGRKAKFRDIGSWPGGLDSHGIHVMRGTYRKARK